MNKKSQPLQLHSPNQINFMNLFCFICFRQSILNQSNINFMNEIKDDWWVDWGRRFIHLFHWHSFDLLYWFHQPATQIHFHSKDSFHSQTNSFFLHCLLGCLFVDVRFFWRSPWLASQPLTHQKNQSTKQPNNQIAEAPAVNKEK